QTEDQLQPAESDRVQTTPSGGNSGVPGVNNGTSSPAALNIFCGQAATCPTSAANLTANFNLPGNIYNRAARFRAYDPAYSIPETVDQCSVSWQQQWGTFVSTVAYVGSQGRNLFLRDVANRIIAVRTSTSDGSAVPVRQFDIDCSGSGSLPTPCTTTPAFTPGPNAVL